MTRYRIAPDVRWTERNSAFYALHLSSGKYLVLRDAGAFVMNRLGKNDSLERIAEALAAEYGIAEDIARGDVQEVVGELADGGFLSADG